jgi:hypothetical protein
MYKVEWKDTSGRECIEELNSLSEAMDFATKLGILVTIHGNGIEVIGTFGSAGVEQGLLPSGDPYTWYKRRRL